MNLKVSGVVAFQLSISSVHSSLNLIFFPRYLNFETFSNDLLHVITLQLVENSGFIIYSYI